MNNNIMIFLERVSTDEELAHSFEEVCKLDIDEAKAAVIKLAVAHGITLTEEDLQEEAEPSELDEEELTAVYGGSFCSCVISGSGIADRKTEQDCNCHRFGFGKEAREDGGWEYTRCSCYLGGNGRSS